MTKNTEADKFDAVVRTLLSVSHEELQKRDKEWRTKRLKAKKKAERGKQNGER